MLHDNLESRRVAFVTSQITPYFVDFATVGAISEHFRAVTDSSSLERFKLGRKKVPMQFSL